MEDNWLDEVSQDAIDISALPKEEQLGMLATLAEEQLKLEKLVSELEASLTATKKQLRVVSEGKIPELMREVGLRSFELTTGQKVSVKPYTTGSIKDPASYDWFEAHGLADIVKMNLTVSTRRSDKAKMQELIDIAATLNVEIAMKEAVHFQTLGAVLRDLMANGKELPPAELVEIYVGNKTTIK